MLNQILLISVLALSQTAASDPVDVLMSAADTSGIVDTSSESSLEAGLFDALNEAAYTLCAFVAAGAIIQAMKKRNTQSKALRSAAKKAEKLAVEFPADTSFVKRPRTPSPSTQQRKAVGSPDSASRNCTGVRKTAVPRSQINNSESDALAAAVRNGRASELPVMLDAARSRLTSSGVDGEELQKASAQHLLSSLRACASRRYFSEALVAYDHAVPHIGMGCSAMWSLLLYSAVEVQEFSRCEDIIRKLLECGLPSGNDFVNIVRYHVAHLRSSEALRQLITDMHHKGLCLDNISRNRALSACSSKHAMDLAEMLADDKICETSIDTVGYNTLMKGYSQAGEPSRCFELYEKLKSAEHMPSDITFGIMLDACIDAKDFERARRIFQDLRNSDVHMNVVHYTTFMKGLASAGQLQDATEVLEDMLRSSDTKPDLVTYSTLIKAHSDHGKVMDAIKVLKRMLDQGIFADAVVFNIVLTGCCVNPLEPAQIFHVFQCLVSYGLKTSTTTLSILIKALAQTKSWGQALELLETAPVRLNIVPEARLYAQLAQACAKAGNGARVLETYTALVRSAGRRGGAVDEETSSRLCRLCASCGESSRGTRLAQAVARAGGYLNTEALDELLKQRPEETSWRSQMVACA